MIRCDAAQVREFLSRLWRPDWRLVEFRALACRFDRHQNVVPANEYPNTIVGNFTSIDAALYGPGRLDGANGYVSLNQIDPAVLARGADTLFAAKKEQCLSDAEVIRWDHCLIDIDIQRPKGISSTDAELNQCLTLRDRIRTDLPDLARASFGLMI